MFDQFKKLHELKKMQDEFKRETETVEKDGVFVSINGAFEVTEIKLNPDFPAEKQAEILKNCLNEAREKIQKKLAQKMMSSGISF